MSPLLLLLLLPLRENFMFTKEGEKAKYGQRNSGGALKKRRIAATAAARVAGVGWLLVNAKKSP